VQLGEGVSGLSERRNMKYLPYMLVLSEYCAKFKRLVIAIAVRVSNGCGGFIGEKDLE
jgi:hypothetical protein